MKISVIIASYNYAQYIEEAIKSVIDQSYQDWELIIIDDGSSDNSVDIINSYRQKDNRIKLLQHVGNKNKGLKGTILLGLENATGEWIAFLESDDFWEINYLEEKIKIIDEYADAELIFNKVKFLDETSGKNRLIKGFEKKQKKLAKLKFPRNMFYDFYINNMLLTFSCVAVKSSVLKKTNFNTPSDTLLDWWLWVHIAYKNKFYYIDEELTNWRLHSKSYIEQSRRRIFLPVQVQAYIDVFKNNEKSLKLFLFLLFSSVKLFFVLSYRFIRKMAGKIFK